MPALRAGRFVAATFALPLAVGVTACGSSGGGTNAQNTSGPTCPATINQAASTPIPDDVPDPGGTTYSYSKQGATQVWFVALDGSADTLASLRDAYDQKLTSAGYDIEGTDQEEGAEAESEFKGPHEGTTNFRTLCGGKVVLRLKLTS